MCFQVTECCCFSLKTGCKIIGVVDTILQLTVIIINSIGLLKSVTEAELAGIISGAILSLCASGLLILGTLKNKPRHLLFWIVFKGISLTLYCIVLIILIIHVYSSDVDGVPVILFILLLVFIVALSIFSWDVVKSYRAMLIETVGYFEIN